MAQLQTAEAVAVQPRRRHYFLLGFFLVIAGVAIYVVQVSLKQYVTPWYTPVLATAGVLLMALSVWQRRGILRPIGLVLFLLLCGFEWYILLVETRLPTYSGPAKVGQKIPAFSASLANGNSFTENDLEKDAPTVLVFFRGHW